MQVICCVRDVKAEAFIAPFFSDSLGAAIRSFSDAVSDANCMISRHPEDFQFWKIGEFDSSTGAIDVVHQPVFLHNATEFIRNA